jgi:hypothetical protein
LGSLFSEPVVYHFVCWTAIHRDCDTPANFSGGVAANFRGLREGDDVLLQP